MIDNACPGSTQNDRPSGCVNENVFFGLLETLFQHANCSMDNYSSHISFAVADFAYKNGVWLITFYLHISHKLQPLDQTVFGPFKRFYSKALDN